MRTTILPKQRVPAGDSGALNFQLQNDAGQDLSLGQITTFTLTLFEEAAGVAGLINGRLNQSVLNTNQVTVGATGAVTWSWVAADMPFLFPERPVEYETHVAKFVVTWSGGQHTFFQTFEIERTGL